MNILLALLLNIPYVEDTQRITCGLKPLIPLGCDELICICDVNTGTDCSWMCVSE